MRCKKDIRIISACNAKAVFEKTIGDLLFYRLETSTIGQKEFRITHGDRETRIFFFVTENPRELLRKHARFIAENQFYENPDDPFGRFHTFLPYDDNRCTIYTDSDETFQVCALDEYCLPPAMFLAEKNIEEPDAFEIEQLETFINDSLFKTLQNPETYLARRSMYWDEIMPSDDYFHSNKWSKEAAESTLRSFNYPLICDIYYAMYWIALKGNTQVRNADQYLEMTYRTAMVWFDVGKNKWNGAPAGATITRILNTLRETRPQWYAELDEKVNRTARINNESDYPYGSELYIDQTPHNQLQALMVQYGFKEKLDEVYRITLALRAGRQPAWFLYGNEKRGNVCCWYSTPLNTRVLYDGFEVSGDRRFLELGYGGLASFLSTLRCDGAAHGWFLWWPDRTGFDSRSLDTDMGVYGYLISARGYVVDDNYFGLCGFGCSVEAQGDVININILDGVGKQFYAEPWGLKLEALAGSMDSITLSLKDKSYKVEFVNGTGQVTVTIGEGWSEK
jgi:hypothetical protein